MAHDQNTHAIDPLAQLHNRNTTERLVDFIYEIGMLRHTPRSGYPFLGTGSENVAEHSHRVAVLGYVLAQKVGADVPRTVFMCLFHDVPEARTGDFNYVNKLYNKTDPRLALTHATEGTGMQHQLLGYWDELEENASLEAKLAHDADQLDLIFNLKRELENGNAFAQKWLESAVKRLHTDVGREFAHVAIHTPSHNWWFNGPDASWWARKPGNNQE